MPTWTIIRTHVFLKKKKKRNMMMSDKDEVFVIGQKYLWKEKPWLAPVLEVSVVAQYFGKSDDDDGITELGKDCTVLVRNESNADLLYWVRPSDLLASAEQRRGAQLKPSDFADSEG
jgi:hypothetical protein